MKAIHNYIFSGYFATYCCYQSQNYKIWKQFTTACSRRCNSALLLSITKLQNLKAIHNYIGGIDKNTLVVINHKTTKFESNSQHIIGYPSFSCCCYQSQNYKIWKQFTTKRGAFIDDNQLLSITKLQNLKVIHNPYASQKSSKVVVINHKTTKFESNSQRTSVGWCLWLGCYQSQNYKIWKQFTTIDDSVGEEFAVVINHKTTKFESNSQHGARVLQGEVGCYQSQNYKIWKQFIRRWNLKPDSWPLKVVINHKTTKFESNSQL